MNEGQDSAGNEDDKGNLGRRAGEGLVRAPADEGTTSVLSAALAKTVGWVLGGFSLLAASVGALSLVPRVVGAYQDPVLVALSLMLVAFVLAGAGGGLSLYVRRVQPGKFLFGASPRWWERLAWACLGLGCVSVIVSIGIVLTLEAFVLGRAPVARLAISVAEAQASGSGHPPATVKLTYRADGLNPNTFIVVDILGIPVTALNERVSDARGERIYRALVGSDGTGRAEVDIETQIPPSRYTIVVAEAFPDKDQQPRTDRTFDDEAFGYTHLCGDIGPGNPRACVWSRVPDAPLPG
jgi:hypothetical protein